MIQQVDAVYENGVLRPLAPLTLQESQRVRITIVDSGAGQELLDKELIERARTEVSAMTEIPTIEEVRALLSTIPGSMAEAVSAERGEY
jgi:predicted DNA-binding antitoxin AbrB/MazE fold protein